jgi:RNA polymerase sigma-70 factor (ECF subfamily)
LAEADFHDFFVREFPAVARTAYLILGDRALAEDVAQEALTRALVRWRRIGRYDKPGAWVRRVAIRLALRAGRRRPAPLDEIASVVPSIEARVDVRNGLAALPRMQRAAVVLHYFEQMPAGEIADVLGCAEATVRVHLHRARTTLARLLGEEVNDVPG